jgi:phage terminase small subunit
MWGFDAVRRGVEISASLAVSYARVGKTANTATTNTTDVKPRRRRPRRSAVTRPIDGLAPKHAIFAREYLVDLNATAAAERAGYARPHKTGALLLRRPEVAKVVRKHMEARAAKTAITAESVIDRINRIAEKCEKDGDMPTALRALELLGKHLRLFSDRLEIDVGDRLAERLRMARERRLVGPGASPQGPAVNVALPEIVATVTPTITPTPEDVI